jgi:hypothetical protein
MSEYIEDDSDDFPKAFWRHWSVVGRLLMTTLSLPFIWIIFIAIMGLAALILAILIVTYPLMHFLWGMTSPLKSVTPEAQSHEHSFRASHDCGDPQCPRLGHRICKTCNFIDEGGAQR